MSYQLPWAWGPRSPRTPVPSQRGERRAGPDASVIRGQSQPQPGEGAGGCWWSSLWLGKGAWAGAGVGRAQQRFAGRSCLIAGSAEGTTCPRAHQPLRHRCPEWASVEVPGRAVGHCAFLPALLGGDSGQGGVQRVAGTEWGSWSPPSSIRAPDPHRCVQPGFAALLMLPGHISL